VHGEQTPREPRREPVQARAQRPLRARRGRGGGRGGAGSRRGRREEAVDRERQRVLELAGHAQPRVADDPPRRVAAQALQMPDLRGVRALGRAARREVVLERHLDDHRPAHPRRLRQQRRRVADVLEHVAQDAEVVRPARGG
jgi:hypothetical protein